MKEELQIIFFQVGSAVGATAAKYKYQWLTSTHRQLKAIRTN